MRYRTILVTGVEVLHLGGQHWESNDWPPEHWRQHKGRWRLFTIAIDDFLSSELKGKAFGSTVESLVVALEVADFAAWPAMAFTSANAQHSYKPKHKQLWCFAKLNWPEVMNLTVSEQYRAYASAVLESVQRLAAAPRKPRNLDVNAMHAALAESFSRGKPSHFTRTAKRVTADA